MIYKERVDWLTLYRLIHWSFAGYMSLLGKYIAQIIFSPPLLQLQKLMCISRFLSFCSTLMK